MKDVIIIPTYNEKENIRNLVNGIFALLPSVHVLVVDDSSPDGTAREVEELKKENPNLELLLRPKKEGLGKAYIAAFKKILSDTNIHSICTMDADFSHSVRYLPIMFSKIQKFDIVVGSRYIKGGSVEGYSLFRKILSRLASFYSRKLFRLPIKDYTSGFMAIRVSLLRKIDLERISSSGFGFLIELKYLLWKKGGNFREVPIVVKNRKEGKSKIEGRVILEGFLLPWEYLWQFMVQLFRRTK